MATEKTLKIEGMTCNHCVMSVSKELEKVPGASGVTVDLATATAHLTAEATVTDRQLAEAIEEAGYKLVSVA